MLINKTEEMRIVKITLADGTKDSINLQPRSRAVPPEGSKIDEIAYSSYVGVIAGIENYKAEAPVAEEDAEEAEGSE